MSTNGFDDEPLPVVRRRSRISLRFVAGSIIFGILLGLAITLVLLVIVSRGQPPRMTAAAFEAAKRRWSERGPANYDMDIRQSLGVVGTVHVEVRDRQVTAMTINGRPAPERLWDNWSVPGLFEIIGMDSDRDAAAERDSQPAPVFQQAEFDPDTGLPRVYRRTELAAGQTVEWRVVAFRARGKG